MSQAHKDSSNAAQLPNEPSEDILRIAGPTDGLLNQQAAGQDDMAGMQLDQPTRGYTLLQPVRRPTSVNLIFGPLHRQHVSPATQLLRSLPCQAGPLMVKRGESRIVGPVYIYIYIYLVGNTVSWPSSYPPTLPP